MSNDSEWKVDSKQADRARDGVCQCSNMRREAVSCAVRGLYSSQPGWSTAPAPAVSDFKRQTQS